MTTMRRILSIIAFTNALTLGQQTSSAVRLSAIPILGLGTWGIEGNTTEVIASAIENGYRHFDCAFAYGNQREVGLGIKEGLKRTGLSRQDIWITGKLFDDR